MKLIKLTEDEIKGFDNKIIICFKKSFNLQELYERYGIVAHVVIDNNVSKQGEILMGNTKVPVIGMEYIYSVDMDNCEIIITGDYYREAFKCLSDIDIVNLGKKKVYYFVNKETEIEEKYREMYKDSPLENIIIFRSGPHITEYIRGMDFADNSKAVFEYMLEHGYNKEYELIWFVKNPDEFAKYEQYDNVSFIALEWSISDDKNKRDKYYRALCLAKYIFFSDAYGIAKCARKDQIRIQLWHGCGFKTRLSFAPCRDRYEYMTVTGDLYAKIHKELFGLDSEQVLITGNAKTDWLFNDDIDKYFEMLGIGRYNKYIFWLPTFRQGMEVLHQNNGYEIASEIGLPVVDDFSKMEKLNKILFDNDSIMIIKQHPYQERKYIQQKSLSNVVFLDNYKLYELGIHINHLLGKADALISDYSSVAVDFLALNRPMAFVLEDIEKYEEKRGFVFENIVENLPGKEIYCFDDFSDFIEEIIMGEDSTLQKRGKLAKGMIKHMDGNNCKRIIDALGIELNR